LLHKADPQKGQHKEEMKQVVVVALLLSATGLAQAEEEKEVPRPKRNIEEVVVTGYSWNPNEHKSALMMGLSGAYLIHEYDKVRDEWRFVRASNQPKKDNE
jgi:hypothetical protein